MSDKEPEVKEVKAKVKPSHYVNNEEFLADMSIYRADYLKYKEDPDNVERPVLSNTSAVAFMKISKNLATKPNFRGYTFVEEMVLDGIENCIAYAHNFNPEKSKNPFSYFTQIIYYAFIRRIQKEAKQTTAKRGLIRNIDLSQLFSIDISEGNVDLQRYYEDILKDYFK
jgi:hypothetical protein